MDEDTAQQALNHAEELKRPRNPFESLYSVNCSKHIEKKNGFSYLSWPFAVAELRKHCPDATWRVVRDEAGNPYRKTECGYFVEVAVKVDGIELSQIHPVMDHRHDPIAKPNAFHVNTSIQRCLVKAIALHGLGLSIYAGEDVPPEEKAERQRQPVKRPNKPVKAEARRQPVKAEAQRQPVKRQDKPVTAEQAKKLRSLIKGAGVDEERFCVYFKVDCIESLLADKLERAEALIAKKKMEAA